MTEVSARRQSCHCTSAVAGAGEGGAGSRAHGHREESTYLPHVTTGDGEARQVRLFPERLPIGIHVAGRGVIVYVIDSPDLNGFRAFLERHAALLRALTAWTLRIVIPPRFPGMADRAKETVRFQLMEPFRDVVIDEMRWYIAQVRSSSSTKAERFARARRAFSSSRVQVVDRRGKQEGEAALISVGRDAKTRPPVASVAPRDRFVRDRQFQRGDGGWSFLREHRWVNSRERRSRELAEWPRTSLSLPVGVLVGVPRSGSVESVDQDRRRRTEITQRLQREIRCDVRAGFKGFVRRFERLGVTAAETGVRGHGSSAGTGPGWPRLRRRSTLDYAGALGRVQASLAPLAAHAAWTRPACSRSNRQLLERRLDVAGPSGQIHGPPGFHLAANVSPVRACSIGRERNARSSPMTCARDSKPRSPSRLTYAFQLACARVS